MLQLGGMLSKLMQFKSPILWMGLEAKPPVQARSQKFAMKGCFGNLGAEPQAAGGQWGRSPLPSEAQGSGGGAPSPQKFCITSF